MKEVIKQLTEHGLLEGLLEGLPIRLFWKDREQRYLGCNTLFAKDAGLSGPDDLIGKTDFDMGWKAQAELYRADDQRVMDSGEPKLNYEEPQTTPDGSTIWLRTSKVPLHNEGGEVIGILGIYEDVTAEKESQQQLLLDQNLFAALSRAQSLFITDAESRGVFESLLDEMLSITQSEYGFIARVLYDESDQPYIKTLAITNIAWDEEMRAYHDEHVAEGLELRNRNTLFGHVLTSGDVVIANDASHDSRGSGVPHGHPALNAFLGIPVYMNDNMIGMLGIANRPQGYSQQSVELLTPLVAVCAQLIGAYRTATQRKQMEQQLHASEIRFKKIFNSLQDTYYRTDAEGMITLVSPSAAELMACEADQLLGTAIKNYYVVEGERQKFLQALSENDGVVSNFEARIRRLDGKVIWVSTNAHYRLDEAGNIDGVEGTIRDVSAQKELVEELRLSKFVSDHAPDCTFWIDEQARIHYVNEATCLKLGYSKEELLGMSIPDLDPDYSAEVWPQHWQELKQRKELFFETRQRHRDGTVIPFEVSANFVKFDDIEYNVAFLRDISDRKAAEALLLESESRFRNLFEYSPDPCWIIDENNHFVLSNQAAVDILGYENSESLQSTHPSKLSPEIQPDGQSSFEKANEMMRMAQEKGIHRFEWEHRRKNGECFPVEVTLSRIELNGKVQLYCTWKDISERKRAEANLLKVGQQYAEAERLAHLGHWRLDLKANQLEWSEEVFRIFNFDPKAFEASYEAFLQAVHPDDRELVRRTYEESVENRTGYKTEHRILMPDGSLKWVIERGETAYSDEGEPLVSTGTVLDITSQKRAEEKLRLSEERFALAMAGANDGLWDWNLETNEVYYSPRWFEMLGYEFGVFPQTLDTWEALVHPDDRAWVLQSVADYLEGRVDSFDVEMRMQHKDGHNVFVLSRATKALHAADGKPVRLVGTHVDITERKAHQAMLEASKKRFEELFESSTDAIFILDMHGNFIDINKTAHERLGYTKEEMLLLSVKDLDPPEFAVKVPTRMKQIMESGSAVFESAHYRKDHSIMPVEINARKLDLDGQEVVLSIVRDISERKALEAQLRQSQKMESVGTLVGGIAHDFNNMLAAVQGNVYLARRLMKEHPVAAEKLDNIEKLSTRAANMVQQLLTFARKDIVQMSVFSLNAFMEEGYSLARAAIPENIDHKTSVCDEMLYIKGDATQLQQVLFNLLNNAVDAVAEVLHPEIRCSLTAYEADEAFMYKYPDLEGRSFACITVRDNGHGIPSERLDKIFEPFFTTKEVGKGTGLGLAMLYGAVQTHGGAVEVESEAGRDTSFKVYLPVCHEIPDSESEENTSLGQGQGETVLLVDDEKDLRETTAEVLHEMGYKVIQAANGIEALEAFKTRPSEVRLILSDVIMPKMGGVQLLQAIRKLDRQVPVLLATGYDKGDVLDHHAVGDHCQVIHKPFDFDYLGQMIQELIQ